MQKHLPIQTGQHSSRTQSGRLGELFEKDNSHHGILMWPLYVRPGNGYTVRIRLRYCSVCGRVRKEKPPRNSLGPG